MLIYQIPGSLETLDHITPALWEAGAQGLEEREDHVLVYFETRLELPFGGVWLEADDTDWIAQYRASLRPVNIGRFVINPGWETSKLELNADSVVIDLEPGFAFGTGQDRVEILRVVVGEFPRNDFPTARLHGFFHFIR